MTKNAPFQVLGPAPDGVPCACCGQGGADVQIMHRSHVDFWHRRCAQQYFEAAVPEPVVAPDAR
jgi:hypothetical protein